MISVDDLVKKNEENKWLEGSRASGSAGGNKLVMEFVEDTYMVYEGGQASKYTLFERYQGYY